MSFITPLGPGETVSRVDMGVDLDAPPGTVAVDPVPGTSRAVGVIRNWYRGQPFEWFRVLTGPYKGRYWYGAEQLQLTTPVGGTVQQGDPIGTFARSGTGTEWGWATASGRTQAQATTGYTEGQPTAAGLDWLSRLRGARATGSKRPVVVPRGSSLGELWIQAGGPPGLANIMAAIAMAESGGRIDAVNQNTNGTVDRGPWQINSSHGQFDANRLLSDPLYSAQAAVQVWRSQGLAAWTTYQTGAYRQYLGTAGSAAVVGGRVRPGGQPAGQPPVDAAGPVWASYESELSAGDPNSPDFVGLGGLPGLGGLGPLPFNPLETFKNASQAVSDVGSFLKWIAWIFHPRNILRIVEGTVGLTIMGFGLHSALLDARGVTPGEAPVRRVVRTAVEATPVGREARLLRARRQGRSQARAEHRRSETSRAYKQGRQEGRRGVSERQNRRESRQAHNDDIPF